MRIVVTATGFVYSTTREKILQRKLSEAIFTTLICQLLVETAPRAEPFELRVLAAYNKAFMRTVLYRRYYHLCKTAGVTAVSTDKVRVALTCGAVMSKFKIPGSFSKICLVNKVFLNKTLESAVNCNLIRAGRTKLSGYLLLCNWSGRFK